MNKAVPAERAWLWGCQVDSDPRKGMGRGAKGEFTWVLTPKSQSFTWPRVFTNILDGFTSIWGKKVDYPRYPG